MNADAVKELIYRSCMNLDDERFDDYLALCTDDYRYRVTAYSPELRKDMLWLEHGRDGLKALFDMLPEHVKPEGRFARHAQIYTMQPNGEADAVKVTSAVTVYFSDDRGHTRLFAVGRYSDVVDLSGDAPKLKSRELRLDTRALGTGTQIPL